MSVDLRSNLSRSVSGFAQMSLNRSWSKSENCL